MSEFKDREDGMAFLREKQAEIEAQRAAEAENKTKVVVVEPVVETPTVETPVETPTAETPIEVKKTWQELIQDELEAKKKEEEENEFKDFMNDELVKTLYTIKKQGKDPKEFVKTLHEVNPSSFTEKQLFEASVSQEKNEEGQSLTQEEIDEKWEQFQLMPKSVQSKFIESQRNDYQKKYEEATKSFKGNNENPYLEAAKKSTDELKQSLDTLVGKKIFGVDVTPNIAKDLYNEALEQLKTTLNGKEYNAKVALEKAISIKMLPSLVNEAQKAASTEAKLELFKQFNTPSSSGKPVQTTEMVQKSKEEIAKEQLEAHAQRASDPFGMKKSN